MIVAATARVGTGGSARPPSAASAALAASDPQSQIRRGYRDILLLPVQEPAVIQITWDESSNAWLRVGEPEQRKSHQVA